MPFNRLANEPIWQSSARKDGKAKNCRSLKIRMRNARCRGAKDFEEVELRIELIESGKLYSQIHAVYFHKVFR